MIRRHEYRFVLVVGILALLLTSIPYLLGAILATDTRIFGGFVYGVEDCYTYLAKMRLGAEGKWLFRVSYTAEPSSATLYYPFYLLLGKIALLWPGGDLTTRIVRTYHTARVILGLGLLLTVYRFISTFTDRVLVRRLAWLMVTFGSGLGWLLVALGQPDWLGSMPLDFILPEAFTFLILYALPHIALARTFLLWGILFLLRSWRERSTGGRLSMGSIRRISRSDLQQMVLVGGAWLLMGLVMPFYIAVVWAVVGAGWLVLALRKGYIPWRAGVLAGGAALISSPVVLYGAWIFTRDPVYKAWAAQNLVLSPHPFHYLAAYGLLLALALVALRDAWQDRKPLWFALSWVGIVPVLVYFPFNLQRRLAEGVQIPLSLLAALGLVKLSRYRRSGRKLRPKLMIGLTLILLSLTNVMLVAGNCLALRGWPSPIYRDAAEIAAMDWLEERVGFDDVVLSSYETGNYLPVRAEVRVFLGHGSETVHSAEKREFVARFYDVGTDDTWRRQLLTEYGVDWVWWGPQERALGAFDPGACEYLDLVYDAEGHAVFEVVR